MCDGIQIFVFNRGQVAKLDAAIFAVRAFASAIDRNLMAALHQAHGDLFRESLKPAIVGGNASGA
jgi:hypothetical protein